MSKRQIQEGGSRIFYNPMCVTWVVMGVIAMMLAGCNRQQKSSHQLSENSSKGHSAELNRSTSIEAAQKSPQTETTSPTASGQATARTYDIPRFVINSPFDIDYDSPVPMEGKRLWARSCGHTSCTATATGRGFASAMAGMWTSSVTPPG